MGARSAAHTPLGAVVADDAIEAVVVTDYVSAPLLTVDKTANIVATNIIKSAILYENELFGSVIRKIGPRAVAVILIAAAPILVLDENLSTVPTDAGSMVDDDVVNHPVRPSAKIQRAKYVPRLEVTV